MYRLSLEGSPKNYNNTALKEEKWGDRKLKNRWEENNFHWITCFPLYLNFLIRAYVPTKTKPNKKLKKPCGENCTNCFSKCFSTLCRSPLHFEGSPLKKTLPQQTKLRKGPHVQPSTWHPHGDLPCLFLWLPGPGLGKYGLLQSKSTVSSDNRVKFSLVCSK